MRSLVLDHAVSSVEGLAASLVRCPSRHGNALAERTLPSVLGEPVPEGGKARTTIYHGRNWEVDSNSGSGESLVESAAHSRRVAKAWSHGFGEDCLAHPADGQATAIANLENL